ncbi:hypothetical protein LUZ60_012938 [Juncus effusus]|nr:hypothetical protein LUZ60_012938 [Juncus effusus]
MSGERVSWRGLLKWSLSRIDGTHPSPHISEEERQWFVEAMEARTVDMIKRMKEISMVMSTPLHVLESQGVSSSDLEDMLDELHERVESIDNANDLVSVGGLFPLLNYLKNRSPKIRAKSAQVITTLVQNNPTSQNYLMEASGFEPLFLNFMFDSDLTARIKALGAISSLIRNNKQGVNAFRLANGYAGLRDAMSSDSTKFQRKALDLTQYLITESNSDCTVITKVGFPHLMLHLASSQDSGVRESALSNLLELIRNNSNYSLFKTPKMRKLLEGRMSCISMMSAEDLYAAREERWLVESLWNACYDEPSVLFEEGLVVLNGEDEFELPADVASRYLPSRFRVWEVGEK